MFCSARKLVNPPSPSLLAFRQAFPPKVFFGRKQTIRILHCYLFEKDHPYEFLCVASMLSSFWLDLCFTKLILVGLKNVCLEYCGYVGNVVGNP